jgi:subtilisin family serine protease
VFVVGILLLSSSPAAGAEPQRPGAPLQEDEPVLPIEGAFSSDDGERSVALLPNDELFDTYQWNLRQIKAPEAWDLTTGSASTIIAILDTGISLTHPDLDSKLVPGYDFVNDDAVPDDDHGNGTHVAGIAAAETNNGIGIAGLAWQARLMPVKVLDANARGDAMRAAQGVTFAVDHGAKIVNLDLVGADRSPALQDAIDYAYTRGVLVIAPVGTDGSSDPSYPAASQHVMAVAATDRSDRRLASSNTGDYISVAAPGESIGSTFRPPGGANGYAVASTTAQAAAQVSGLAALMLAINPRLTPDDLRAMIEKSSDDVGAPGRDPETGYGRINAARAVQFAAPWNDYPHGAGSYVAQSAPRNTTYFPLILKEANGTSTSFTVQNTARFTANIQLQVYDSVGRPVYSSNSTLPASGSITYEPSRVDDIPRGFIGSAVVRGDVPLAGVVNEDNPFRDRMTYEAISQGASLLWIPLLMRDSGGWNTGLQIQNLGTSPTDARVTFFTRGSSMPLNVRMISMNPFASQTLYQPLDDRIPPDWVGSAVVESLSGEPLGAIVNQVHATGAAMAYVGVAQTAPLVYAPLLFRNSGGWSTGFQVQNAGTSDSALAATYTRTNGEGGPWTESARAAPGGSATFYQPATRDLPDDFVGAGMVSAGGGQPLGGIVNETRYDYGVAMAYDAPTTGGAVLYVPLVYRGYAGWDSGIQVQNLGTARTMVTIAFYNSDGSPAATLRQGLDAAASLTAYLPAVDGLPRAFIGSAVATSSGDQPIAAIANHVKLP